MTIGTRIVLGIAIAIAVAFGIFVHDKTVAERALWEARDKSRRDSITALEARADSLKAAFKRDTVRIIRSTHSVDTLLEHRIDTAIVHQSDTVKITVKEAAAIRDTIRACVAVIRTCGERADAAEAETKLWIARFHDLEGQKPGWLRRHLALMAGVGAVRAADGVIRSGPMVGFGFRLWP